MEVTFYPAKQREGKILAFADVVVADGITVRGFRIVDGDRGVFAAVPSRSFTVDGKPRFVNQVTFAGSDIRDRFLSELLDEFNRWTDAQARRGSAIDGSDGSAREEREQEAPF